MSVRTNYSREELIAICEAGVVTHEYWSDRDTARAQQKLGQAWAYLKAGCDFVVLHDGGSCSTTHKTIWIEIAFHGFGHFDWGEDFETEVFYLPTQKRLDESAGQDWY